jgi:hypothetical protein
MVELFPSIIPEADDFIDDSYHRRELEDMDWDEIRAIAAEHPTEEVNGKSDREEMEAALTGEKRIEQNSE